MFVEVKKLNKEASAFILLSEIWKISKYSTK